MKLEILLEQVGVSILITRTSFKRDSLALSRIAAQRQTIQQKTSFPYQADSACLQGCDACNAEPREHCQQNV